LIRHNKPGVTAFRLANGYGALGDALSSDNGKKVCRYLFVLCDNEPAPWTSDEHGDRPRPLLAIKKLSGATDVTDRNHIPCWDYDGSNVNFVWK
ncbi:hypothetical protein MKX01_030139, partial [Papaver californicum]